MNARQKAKKYKKLAEKYKADADSWKQYARTEAAKHHETAAKVKTVHFCKLIPNEQLVYMPEDVIKKEIATDIGQTLNDENLIRWRVEDAGPMNCRRFSGKLEVLSHEEERE